MDSDPEIEFIEKDSGMSSPGGSKDETPERRTAAPTVPTVPTTVQNPTTESVNYDDEPDETLGERLWGLTEMFPEQLRHFTGNVYDLTTSGIKNAYKFSCTASWIFFSTSLVLFAPVIFETERAQMQEMQRSQQKQVLLGPGNVPPPSSAGNNTTMPLLR